MLLDKLKEQLNIPPIGVKIIDDEHKGLLKILFELAADIDRYHHHLN